MNDPATCAYIPFDGKNPYQPALVRALGKLGVQVQGQAWRWLLLKQLRGMDVVHIHWTSGPANERPWKFALGYPALAAQLLWLRLQGRRIVWTVHNLESHEKGNPARDRLVSWLLGRVANGVIVHGESAKGAVARRFGVGERKIRVIPHGNYIGLYPDDISASEARRRLGLGAQQRVVLFLGNIRPYKGVTELIESFRRLAPKDTVLLIAGRPLNSEVQQMVERLAGHDGSVRFQPGFVEDSKIQEYMNASDVVVFPYREVLTSGAIVLAMSFGKACVAPRLGCIPDVLDGEGAFLYDADKPDGLEGALRAALDAGDRLGDMGRRNRKRAEAWSWDRIAAQTLEVYRHPQSRTAPGVHRQANHV